MPRKSKRNMFRGVPSWKKTVEETDSNVNVGVGLELGPSTSGRPEPNVPESEASGNEHDKIGTINEIAIKVTASEKKLKNVEREEASKETKPTGYRVVHLQSLEDSVNALHKCETGSINLKEDTSRRRGFSSLLFFECSSCTKRTYLQTSDHKTSSSVWKPSDATDINRRVNLAAAEIGVGREAISSFSDIVNMPQPVSKKSWNDNTKTILSNSREEVKEQLAAARKRVREHYNADDDEPLDIPVSFDGTWSKRGFTANYGFGFVMSLDTGEVLDYAVMSKFCSQCSSQRYPKDSVEFKNWYKSHEAACQKNFEGSSGAMERECARKLWTASIDYSLRYKFMVCDGDSKSYNDIWDTYGICDTCKKYENMDRNVKEYKDWLQSDAYREWRDEHNDGSAICHKVQKLDCIGHVQKRMGKALRDLKKKGGKLSDGKGIGGKGNRLTDGCIDKLQLYYGRAIRANTSKASTSDCKLMTEGIENMRKAIMAVLYHSVMIPDEQVRHQYCPEGEASWCDYRKDPTKSIEIKSHHLQFVFLDVLLPIFQRLSDPELLRRCMPGYSQNQNESLNSLVWLRAPKHKHRGPAATEIAGSLAIMHFNKGASAKFGLMQRLGISAGHFSTKGSAQKDDSRIKSAKKAEETEVKQRREKRRQAKRLREESLEKSEGPSYSSGAFNDLDVLKSTANDEYRKKRTKKN